MKRDAGPQCTGNGVRVHQGNKKSNGVWCFILGALSACEGDVVH